MPLESMVPTVEEPPAVPLTAQVTDVLELPVTVAVNRKVLPARMLALVGETETVVEAGLDGGFGSPGFELELAPPPQPDASRVARMRAAAESLGAGRIRIEDTPRTK